VVVLIASFASMMMIGVSATGVDLAGKCTWPTYPYLFQGMQADGGGVVSATIDWGTTPSSTLAYGSVQMTGDNAPATGSISLTMGDLSFSISDDTADFGWPLVQFRGGHFVGLSFVCVDCKVLAGIEHFEFRVEGLLWEFRELGYNTTLLANGYFTRPAPP